MRRFALLTIALSVYLCNANIFAGEIIKTRTGSVYSNCSVRVNDPLSVIVTHDRGVAWIPFEDLNTETQNRYGYDPTNAAAYKEHLDRTNKTKPDVFIGRKESNDGDESKSVRNENNNRFTTTPSADAPTSKDAETGLTTKSGQTIYRGSRGGLYHYSKSGNKVYEKKR